MLTPSKPIKVLVVGAGFGGLAAAIECHRQGHHVEMYESFPEHKVLGDMITLGANASRIVFRWDQGQLMKQLLGLSLNIREYGFRIHKWDSGEVVHVQRHGPPKGKEGMVMAMPPSTGGVPPPMPPNGMGGPPPGMCMPPKLPHIGGHRGELHAAIYTYARDKLQIPIHLGNNITEYEEGDDECALVTSTGQKVYADVIIGADGVRSKARDKVLGIGHDWKPANSGFAVWRTWFPSTGLAKDPKTEEFTKEDTFNGWLGPDQHFLFCTLKGGKECCWFLTHRNDDDTPDFRSWSTPGDLKDVVKTLDGWDPLLKSIVEKTPAGNINEWKLANWPPLPSWVSEKGRIALLGDSAHPFLPSSAQGAGQAMEDAVTLALCLKKAGKGNVPAALRTYQDIRYDRVKMLQKTGDTNREKWHKVDWEEARKNPESIELPREDWIYDFDAEKHAEKVFEDLFSKRVDRAA